MPDVGEGKTSAKREGGLFLSFVQIPAPHVVLNGLGPAWDRPWTAEAAGWVPQAPTPESTAGVLGWEVVGDMEVLANDSFRWRGGGGG